MSQRVGLDDFYSIPDAPAAEIPGLHTSESFLASVPEYDESKDYLGALLRGGQRVSIVGKMGEGKTYLLMEMAAAAARGGEFLGFKGAGVRVLYVNLEMGDEEIGDAMRSARLPHPNFSLLHRPDGLSIDLPRGNPTGDKDRRLIWDLALQYQIIIFDPWYQLLRVELAESHVVGSIIRYLQGLVKKNPATCFVFGKHVQENAQKTSVGNISGFKAFERNSSTIIGFERVVDDTSRLRWLKVRQPHRIGAKMGDRWTIEWTRGEGFTRIAHAQSSIEAIRNVLSREWKTKAEIVERSGRSARSVELALAALETARAVETSGGLGRGKFKFWRLPDPNQEVLLDVD